MDNYTCDVCGASHSNVIAGRWVFYCGDNPKCAAYENKKIYENELVPALESGEMLEDSELLEAFI